MGRISMPGLFGSSRNRLIPSVALPEADTDAVRAISSIPPARSAPEIKTFRPFTT